MNRIRRECWRFIAADLWHGGYKSVTKPDPWSQAIDKIEIALPSLSIAQRQVTILQQAQKPGWNSRLEEYKYIIFNQLQS